MSTERMLRSRHVAEMAGVTVRTLRHYHRIGLLAEPPREANGYRRYGAADVVRLLRIRQLADGGMPLRRIAEVIDDVPDAELLDELEADLDRREGIIAEQRAVVGRLRRLLPHAPRGTAPSLRTDQFDRDAWTVLTGSGVLDEDAAAGLAAVLRQELPVADLSWFAEFQALHDESTVSDADAARLVQRMRTFADTMRAKFDVQAGGSAYGPQSVLIAELAQHRLSPAQHQVWALFLQS